jgi:hypothetical protein
MMDGGTTPYAAFISHSSRDGDAAFALVDALEATGLRVWIAPRDIPAGSTFSGAIVEGIEQSACFVLLLSGAANVSPNVLSEVEKAATLGKPIFPVRLEDVQPSRDLELYIKMIQWVDALDRKMDVAAPLLSQAFAAGQGERRAGRLLHENPYANPGAYKGPVLPPPRDGETWAPVLSDGNVKKIADAKLGRDGLQWSFPRLMGWTGEDVLFYGGNLALLKVALRFDKVSPWFRVPSWSGREIRDAAAEGFDRNNETVLIAGNSFLSPNLTDGNSWGWGRDKPFHTGWWSRLVALPHDKGFAHISNATPRVGDKAPWILWNPVANHSTSGTVKLYPRQWHAEPYATWEFDGLFDIPTDFSAKRTDIRASPTGRFIALACYDSGNSLRVIDLESGSMQHVGGPRSDLRNLRAFAWHSARDVFVTLPDDDEAQSACFQILDAADASVIEEVPITRNDRSWRVDWSPDGRFIAIGGWDYGVLLWDFTTRSQSMLTGHSDAVDWVKFSPDSQRLMSTADGETFIWDVHNPDNRIAKLEGYVAVAGHSNVRLQGSPWSPSGRRIALFTGGAMQVYELGQVA